MSVAIASSRRDGGGLDTGPRLELPRERLHHMEDRREVELLLRLEVAVDRALADSGVRRDRVDQDFMERREAKTREAASRIASSFS